MMGDRSKVAVYGRNPFGVGRGGECRGVRDPGLCQPWARGRKPFGLGYSGKGAVAGWGRRL
jgi:hypothetical protein